MDPDLVILQSLAARLAKTHPVISLDLDVATYFSLISALQLACRHPQFRGAAFHTVRAFLDGTLAQLGGVSPELERIMRKGDSPQNHVPTLKYKR